MNNLLRRLAPALALCLPLVALAQPASVDPAQPSASAAPVKYRSAFADYRPWQDIKPGDWRALNDGLKGSGMSGHNMSAPAPAKAAASAPAATASAPAKSGHGGHPMRGGRP
jgi:hypothetical protein